MHRHHHNHSRLFRLATRSLRYFLLGSFGFAIATVFSSALGFSTVLPFLINIWRVYFHRIAIVIAGLLVSAVLTESIR